MKLRILLFFLMLGVVCYAWSKGATAVPISEMGDHIIKTNTTTTAGSSMLLMECSATSSPFCIGTAEGLVGSSLCVPISAQNYSAIAGFQFSMSFDTSIVTFDSVVVNTTALTDLTVADNFNLSVADTGNIWAFYASSTGVNTSLDDDVVLFELCFTGRSIGESEVGFTDNPLPIVIVDENGEEQAFTGGNGTLTILPCFDTTVTLDTTICVGETIVIGEIVYTAADSYENLLVTSEGCDSLVILNLSITEIEVVLPATVDVCMGEQASVSVPDGFLLGLNGNAQGSTILLAEGVYEITVLDVATGCQNVQTVMVIAQAFPEITIEGSLAVCTGESTTLEIIGSENYAYAWSNGITTAVNTLTAGTYTLTVIDTSTMAECMITQEIVIEELPLPEVNISGDLTFCAGSETELTASGASTYSWNTGETGATVVVSAPGEYCATGTDENGCSTEVCVTVEELPLPEVTISGDLTFCAGSETELTASGASTYSWNTGETGATIVVSTPGEYCATGTDENGCSTEVCVTVEELPLPEVTISGDLTFCAGSETELTASGASTYSWNTGETGATIVVSTSGEYCATSTDENGCSTEVCVTIEELLLPEVNISGDLSFCPGDETTLTANGAEAYEWNTGETSTSIVVDEEGQYCVIGTDANGCSVEICIIVGELPLPVISFSGATNTCDNDPVAITASGGVSYAWSGGENPDEATNNLLPGTYTVTVTNAVGCANEASITIEGDEEDPVFVYCPPTQTLVVNFGETEGVVNWPSDPLVEDNCGSDDLIIESTHNSGDAFPLGVTTVIYTATDNSGNSATCSFEVMVEESAALTFYVDTLDYTIVEDTFCIPVRVLNFSEVAAFQFSLSAPDLVFSSIDTIIAGVDFTSTSEVGGFTFQLDNNNLARLLWLDGNSDGVTVPDSTIAFTLKMTITADFGECIPIDIIGEPLNIEAFQISEGEVRPTVYGGEICVNNLIDIIGNVYKINDDPINLAELTLAGSDSIWLDTTNVAGQYAFLEVVGNEDYTLTPARDFDDVEGLSVTDMIIILRHIQGTPIEDPYLLVAADVNTSTSISTADILTIRELILGNLTAFGNGPSWRFIPASYVFPNPANPWEEVFPQSVDLMDQDTTISVDFIGIKMGDVNLTASGQLLPDGELNLSYHDQHFVAGAYVDVPVYAHQLSEISGFQLGLEFDVSSLQLVEVLPGTVADFAPKTAIGYQRMEEGLLSLVYLPTNETKALKDQEHLFTLRFRAQANGHLSQELKLTDRMLRGFAVNEQLEEMTLSLSAEMVSDTDELAGINTPFAISAIRPNPFTATTILDCYTPATTELYLQLIDIRGVMVYEQKHQLPAGNTRLELPLSPDLPAGVYICRVQTDYGFAITQLIKQ